jgi:5-methylcytosine-specific restriction endonuclease McrA
MRTLLLDNTYFPIKVLSWQKAMILWLTGRAEVVDVYEEIDINSPRMTYKLPKVLKLLCRHKSTMKVRFTRLHVFSRDDFTCQYCVKEFSYGELTLDHIVPLSRGGQTSWENVVSACKKCNGRKGNKMPDEAKMYPNKRAQGPRWTPQLVLRLTDNDPLEWRDYLFIKAESA